MMYRRGERQYPPNLQQSGQGELAMKYKVDDEVITKVTKGDVPSGAFGVADSVEGKDIWVAVYIPADDDVPYDLKK